MVADEGTRRLRRVPSKTTSVELTAEAQKLGEMISRLFDEAYAGTKQARRVREMRAGADVRATRKRRSAFNTPTMECRKCGEPLQGDNLAEIYTDHQQFCTGGR